MRTTSHQYSLYMIFATLSIIINLGSQYLAQLTLIWIVPSFANEKLISNFENWFILALSFGTGMGFIFKFIVDKFVVFQESLQESKKEELQKTGKQLTLYLGFAIITTIIFWGFEFLFKILLTGYWYLVGGLIGLIIGYTVKFILDRTFVFTSSSSTKLVATER